MPDYSKSKIYKITPIGENTGCEIYIGSTTKSLCDRMCGHRCDFKRNKGTMVKELFTKYGAYECKIELIENYPCETGEELRKREGEIIKVENCVNKNINGRTQQEYNKYYRTLLTQEQKKQYYENHRIKQGNIIGVGRGYRTDLQKEV